MKLETLRAEIRALQQQIGELKSATLPPDEIAAAVAGWLNDQEDFNSLTPFGELVSSEGYQTVLPADPMRLLLGLFRDEIQERLTRHLCETSPSSGLPAAKRQKEIGKLIAQRRSLEVDEEIEVLRMEDRGEQVERRSDVDGELLSDVWHDHLNDAGRLKLSDAA